MKFRFCGDGDCPDWVLAEINSTLSVLSAVKLKILTQTVCRSLLGETIPEDKILKTFASASSSSGEPTDAVDPLKSAFACLRFLLVNATRYDADAATFNEELQQLGLPREHSAAICRVRDEFLPEITALLTEQSLTVNRLAAFSYRLPDDESDAIDCATLEVRIANEMRNGRTGAATHSVNISREDIAMLLDELRTIDRIMGETAPADDGNGNGTPKITNGDGVLAAASVAPEVGVTTVAVSDR